MPRMSGARLFAQMMEGYGVTHIYFVPAFMLKAFAEMEDMPIRRIMVHGEKAAAYMADGYARASGKPGVCMAQMIGASNLAAGIARCAHGGRAGHRHHRRAHAAIALPARLPGGRRHIAVRRGDQVQCAGRYRDASSGPAAPGVSRRHFGRAGAGASPHPEPSGADHRGGGRARSAGRDDVPAGSGIPPGTRHGSGCATRSPR